MTRELLQSFGDKLASDLSSKTMADFLANLKYHPERAVDLVEANFFDWKMGAILEGCEIEKPPDKTTRDFSEEIVKFLKEDFFIAELSGI